MPRIPNRGISSTRGAARRTTRDCRTNTDCRPGLSCVNFQCVPGLGSVVGIPGNGGGVIYDDCGVPNGSNFGQCNNCCFNLSIEECGFEVGTDNCPGSCQWYGSPDNYCSYGQRKGGKINKRNNRRNTMRRRGGRTRPKPRGRGRAMARGGRARPAPRGRMARGGRKMPGGGRTCGGMGQSPCPGGGYRRGGRPAPRRMDIAGGMPPPRVGPGMGGPGKIRPRPPVSGRPPCGGPGLPPCPASGYRKGGRTRPKPRRMSRGGRAPMRRFQAGGAGGECPVGTQRSAYGTCLPLDA